MPLGRVKILDPALQASNVPINISVENNSFFNQQNKRFSGVNIVHKVNDKVVLVERSLNLNENPLTQKANYGTEPVNNTMIGFNTNFSTELPFLTAGSIKSQPLGLMPLPCCLSGEK